MKIRNIKHKGLRRLVEADDRSGLPPAAIDKVRKIIAFLQAMLAVDELKDLQSWKPHQLSGDRKGTWSVSVTANWRITFSIDQNQIEILDLNYEDYH